MDPTIGREAHRAAPEIPLHHCGHYGAAVVASAGAIRDQFNWALEHRWPHWRRAAHRVMAMLGNHVAR
jgi:hypothetical protein